MVDTYAALTGDFTPVHVNENYARTTPFGTRVAHGLLGLSLADGVFYAEPAVANLPSGDQP